MQSTVWGRAIVETLRTQYDVAKKLGIPTQNIIHRIGEAAAPLCKPSQRHSTLRGLDAHHVLRALTLTPATCEQRSLLLRNVHNYNNITPSLLQTEPEKGHGPTPNVRKNRTECVSV